MNREDKINELCKNLKDETGLEWKYERIEWRELDFLLVFETFKNHPKYSKKIANITVNDEDCISFDLDEIDTLKFETVIKVLEFLKEEMDETLKLIMASKNETKTR